MKAGISALLIGIAIGVAGILGFNGMMSYTSSENFCANACHEMGVARDTLAGSVHGHNASGVAVACADCHIPKEFGPKMLRKIEASREVWGHLTGLIDTPEKYAAHRPAMRERELARLRATDSRECRNCHRVESMDFAAQERAVRRYHRAMAQRDKTCVDCHEGIAHPAG